jgi:hypothetical protein
MMRTSVMMLCILVGGGCGPGRRCVSRMDGKVLHFGDSASDGVDCVCDGPAVLTCVSPVCDDTERGPWCVNLNRSSPTAGDYSFTGADVQDATMFCAYDTGGDPRLDELASDTSLPSVDCSAE